MSSWDLVSKERDHSASFFPSHSHTHAPTINVSPSRVRHRIKAENRTRPLPWWSLPFKEEADKKHVNKL